MSAALYDKMNISDMVKFLDTTWFPLNIEAGTTGWTCNEYIITANHQVSLLPFIKETKLAIKRRNYQAYDEILDKGVEKALKALEEYLRNKRN